MVIEMSCPNLNVNNPKYPCKSKTYNQCVGKLLPTIIGNILQVWGYKAIVHHQQRNGVDIEVYDWDKKIMVMEVINWNFGTRMNNHRLNSIRSNLKSHPQCIKVLVHTIPLSGPHYKALKNDGILSFFIGYQVVKPSCHAFFQAKGTASYRQAVSASVIAEIESIIFRKLHYPVYLL